MGKFCPSYFSLSFLTMSFQFRSTKKIISLLEEHNIQTIAELVIKSEQEITGHNEEEIRNNLLRCLRIMKDSAILGKENPTKSRSGMVGGDAKKIELLNEKESFLSPVMKMAVEYAIGIMESNARMGKIVAAPTAGSSGIVPGAILAVQHYSNADDQTAIDGLLTAAGIGIVIANIGTFSAAAAGCQAEVGTSSAMAAAAVSAMRGLSPERCINSSALALKNLLGLACDPIGGLVEVPCVKRNGFGVVHALTASDMSLAGITSIIPFDEVVSAMNDIANSMSESIKETAKGGLAITPSGKKHSCMSCHSSCKNNEECK
jgi:L-serine dehydratase